MMKISDSAGFISGILSILTPLTKLAAEMSKSKGSNRKKIPQKREQEHQDAFDEAKKMIESEAELALPDWAKPVNLYPNENEVQLGATLVRN